MFKKNLVNSNLSLLSLIVVLFALVGVIFPYGVEAANISCVGNSPICVGTPDNDNIVGDSEGNNIAASGGNDNMDGKGGNDFMTGGNGNDILKGSDGRDILIGDNARFFFITVCVPATGGKDGDDQISGGSGNDFIVGCLGADVLLGGDGDDKIIHGNKAGVSDDLTAPDGSQDKIDCGPGNDEAWINTSVDHDIATNCEILHSG